MVGRQPRAVAYLRHLHLRRVREQGSQLAFVGRIEVLDEYKRHARVRRQVFEQFHEGFKSAGGCADADDEEGFLCVFLFG